MRAQALRLRTLAENIANADTPGYHRKVAVFRTDTDGRVDTGPIALSHAAVERVFDPGHPLADGSGHRDGSNVDLVVEMADARQAQRSYDANLRMFDQSRQMVQGLFDLLRR